MSKSAKEEVQVTVSKAEAARILARQERAKTRSGRMSLRLPYALMKRLEHKSAVSGQAKTAIVIDALKRDLAAAGGVLE